MHIAFLIDSFPCVSETFILNQITGLIKRNHKVSILIAQKSQETIVHPDVENFKLMSNVIWHNDKPTTKIIKYTCALKIFFILFFKKPQLAINSLNFLKYGRDALSLNLLYKASCLHKITPINILFCHYGHNGILGIKLKQLGLCKKVVTMFHGYDTRRAVAKTINLQPLFSQGDLFLSISSAQKELLHLLGAPESKTILHPVGIDLDKIIPTQLNINQTTFQILTVGRLVKEKNILFALDVINNLIHQQLFENFEYHVVGDGYQKAEIEKAINNKSLGKYIKLLGALSNDKVLCELSKTQVYLSTSIDEVLPVTLMEAQASGVAVVAPKIASIPDIVINERSGYLITDYSPELFAKKIKMLLTQPHLRENMGNFAKQHVQQFDINKLNNQLINHFQKLL